MGRRGRVWRRGHRSVSGHPNNTSGITGVNVNVHVHAHVHIHIHVIRTGQPGSHGTSRVIDAVVPIGVNVWVIRVAGSVG